MLWLDAGRHELTRACVPVRGALGRRTNAIVSLNLEAATDVQLEPEVVVLAVGLRTGKRLRIGDEELEL